MSNAKFYILLALIFLTWFWVLYLDCCQNQVPVQPPVPVKPVLSQIVI